MHKYMSAQACRHGSMHVCRQYWHDCTDVELCMWAGTVLEASVCCEEAHGWCVCMPLFTYMYKTVLDLSRDSVWPA